jgi:glycolate oxidase FAD binding subunit
MNGIASELASILEMKNSVCLWEDISATLQQNIGRAIASEKSPSCVIYPQTQQELAAVIACAYRNSWRVLSCGSGSKLGWGGLASNIDVVVSTERINKLIEHAIGDLTVTVEAGMKFCQLQEIVAGDRQFLALDPVASDTATMGGIVATGDTGSLRQRFGSVRDQLLGITFIRSDGEIAKAGGRVVKNVAGYDLMKLFTGSYGTLGIITQVTFRLYPMVDFSGTVVLTGDADNISKAAATLRNSALTPTQADLVSGEVVSSLSLGDGLGLIVCFQSIEESVKEQCNKLLAVGKELGLTGAMVFFEEETRLWKRLAELIDTCGNESLINCKIGVLPNKAVEILTQTNLGRVNITTGLGVLIFDGDIEKVLKVRSLCQNYQGFLTILSAEREVKKKVDVWGYGGNGLELMRRLKKQFDEKNILSPGRFVGGI